MKTFFITGGEGFIGYHLSQKLLENPENKVVLYDGLKHFVSLNKSDWCYYQDYRVRTLQNDRLVRLRGDVVNRGFLKEALEEHKPDVMIHLAALPIANISNKHPEEATNNVFLPIVTLLDVVRSLSYKVDRVVYISSSMVYGDFKKDENGEVLPAVENQVCDPKGIYCAMKYSGEYVVKSYSKRFGVPYVIIRPSAVYGPTDCNRRVTEIFVKNALLGKELRLDNGGLHKLDFTYVKDLAQGLFLAATSDKALGETFNLTRGEGRTIKELAEILIKMNPDTGCKAIIKEVDVYRPNRGSLDISKAKSLLGYDPKYSLEEGMKEYVEFVKSTLMKKK